MTSGSGIAHSEFSTPHTRALHGLQLWVALPHRHRDTAPAFRSHTPRPVERDGARILVLAGDLAGEHSPVTTYSPLLGAEISLSAGARLHLDVDAGFELGAREPRRVRGRGLRDRGWRVTKPTEHRGPARPRPTG